ncbi:MAG TPA: collagen-like protein [Agriterribacter sp.]|nr:collagen-like protein [Agriterribacter sp.]
MKRLNFPLTLIALFVAGVFLASCTKEGPAGPAGQAGAQGAPGPTGAQGPAGTKGDPGTANVIYSDWKNVTFDENGLGILPAPELSNDILNTGSVKVYWNLFTKDEPFVVSLPCSVFPGLLFDDLEDDAPNIVINPYLAKDTILLSANYNVSSVSGQSQFRYILIPGGTPAARKASSINWNNYAEVKQYLNLKD